MTDSMQLRDVDGKKINPGVKEKQNQQGSHWQVYLVADGTIKAEAAGKVVVITDINFNGSVDDAAYIRQKNASGTIIGAVRIPAKYAQIQTFRQGLEGAAHDGIGGGSLYLQGMLGTSILTATGYMKEA